MGWTYAREWPRTAPIPGTKHRSKNKYTRSKGHSYNLHTQSHPPGKNATQPNPFRLGPHTILKSTIAVTVNIVGMTTLESLTRRVALTAVLLILVHGGVAEAGAPFDLTLMHTGETFAQITAVDLLNSPCDPVNGTYRSTSGYDPCLGGIDRRSALIEHIRASAPNSLLIDAGYMFTGSIFWYLYNSTILAPYYEMLGYDAIKVDIYEFVGGVSTLAYFIEHVNGIPVVASNLVGQANDSRLAGAPIVPYAIFQFADGSRVGYTGTLTGDIAPLFSNSYPLNSTSEFQGMVQGVGALLNHGVDKIIVSVSSSVVLDTIIASVPGIDIVILADAYYANPGNNSVLDFDQPTGAYPQVYNVPWGQPVLVVGSGRFGKNLGVLNVSFDANGVVTSWSGNAVQMSDAIVPNATVRQLIVQQYAQVQTSMGDAVGQAAADIQYQHTCVFGECAIGDWSAGVLRRTGGTQIGFLGGGAMYGPFPRGAISLGEEVTNFPYVGQNQLWTFYLSGKYLLQALEQSVSLADQTWLPVSAGTGRFLQASGVRFTWNPQETVGTRIVDVWVEVSPNMWKLLDAGTLYNITTVDYNAKGGDGYTMFANDAVDVVNTGVFASDPLLADLQASFADPLNVTVDGRIAATNLTRRTCFSSANGTLCNNNGYCYEGACVCTAHNAAGALCAFVAADASGGGGGGGISAGAIVGIVIGSVSGVVLLAFLLLILVVLVLAYVIKSRSEPDDDWNIAFDELEIGEQLGAGGYGTVHKAKWKGGDVAVKVMTDPDSKAARDSFANEMRAMSHLRHPNVVLFMAACTKPPNMCIVMEHMALGSLFDLLHNELVPELPYGLRVKLAYQAAKGMHFLHSSGIVHRDLKSLNLLLDNKWNVKVADFGLTKFKSSIRDNETALEGSVPWMAPEILADEHGIDYTLGDVYAFGVVLWEIHTREEPYAGETAAKVAVAVIRKNARPGEPVPRNEHEALYIELLEECWLRDPTLRPVFLDIMTRLGSMTGESVGGSSHMTSTSTSTSTSNGRARDPWTSQASGDGGSSSSSAHTGGSMSADAFRFRDVPRRDVSYVVCDLGRFMAEWQADASRACRAIKRYSHMVHACRDQHNGYLFSNASLHSGGTFMLSFFEPAAAAAFAADLAADALADPCLAQHSRISLSYRPGPNDPLRDGHARSPYDPRLYKETCDLNVACPMGAVICSATFGEAVSDRGHSFARFGNTSLLLLIVKSPDAAADAAQRVEANDDGNNGDNDDGEEEEELEQRKEDAYLCSSNQCPWILDGTKLPLGACIGRGNFGQVFRATWLGSDVAVKRLANSKLGEEGMRRMRKEAAILSDMNHTNVVKLVGLSITGGGGVPMLVMEFVDGDNLRTRLSDKRRPLSWKQRYAMLAGAAHGIAYLHQRGIIHRDIKSSNLLVDSDGNVKVGDFGFATVKVDNGTMTRCGTPCWTAPEVIKGKPCGTPADVYSFGIVMWEVLTRRVPYEGAPMANVVGDVLDGVRPEIPSDCPRDFGRMMERCWSAEPKNRPTIEDVLVFLNGKVDGSAV